MSNDPIFNINERASLFAHALGWRRRMQAQHLRVLARVEAAEKLRSAQDKVAALDESPVIRRTPMMRPRLSLWRRLFGVHTPNPPPDQRGTVEEQGKVVASAREQLERLVTKDLPRLVDHRDRVATEVQRALDVAVKPEPPLNGATPRAAQSASAPSGASPMGPAPTARWGSNGS